MNAETRAHTVVLLLPSLLTLAYCFWPGDPEGLIPGWPWRQRAGIVFTLVLAATFIRWTAPAKRSRDLWVSIVLAAAVIARMSIAPTLVAEGWGAQFLVVSADGSQPAQRLGPRTGDGRVIDRRIDLGPTSPALQFLNEHGVPPGGAEAVRNVALEARWRGYLWVTSSDRVWIDSSDVSVDLTIDGRPVDLSTPEGLSLSAGTHLVQVVYKKAAGELPDLTLSIDSQTRGPLAVYAEPPSSARLARDRWAQSALTLLDLVMIAAAIAWPWPNVASWAAAWRRRGVRLSALARNPVLMVAVPVMLFSIYGLVAASERADLTLYLIGDDMRQYAADGRDIAMHGLLMNRGQPPFTGVPFHQYPLYPYFVAATHLLFDESMYGLFFLQFVLLGVTFGVLVWLTRGLFGVGTAWLAAGMLCGLGLMNFSRYYTVSVFTDNLYYPLVAAGVAALWQAGRSGTWQAGVAAGLLGGLATLTRPSMMFVLPLAVACLVWLHLERQVRGRHVTAAVVATAWMATVGLATLRNWLASGQFVLIADSSLQILVFLAPPGVDYADYMVGRRPSVLQSVAGAWRIFVDYPLEVLLVQARKLAFMVGFTNIQPSYRLQPGFLLLSAGYAAWWVLRRDRAHESAVVHLTLLAHVIAFLVASPMTYGYKTILTLMMLLVPFVASLAWDGLARVGARYRWTRSGAHAV